MLRQASAQIGAIRLFSKLTNYTRRSFGGLPGTFWWLWLGTLVNRIGIFVSPFLTLFLTGQRD